MFYLLDGLLWEGPLAVDVASSREMAPGSKFGHLFLSYHSQH